ncbi:peptidylprolyl isomerase [Mariniflexile gromovii]|uniref:Peptidylprolyl isomerase n=1 Tax=Mariniflexile gromovii TaxID=362523 RepID=A0ABS4BXJ9_9FLAO|nr:peptidylprolyl isomerase [Mariniflexile gromovii]MBP0905315.1 peptidylprolyl isomerase [Mariniflexile gromovii]
MIKHLLFAAILSGSAFLNAQNLIENELEFIETPEQISEYLALKKSNDNKLLTFNEEKHKTILAKELLELNTGSMKTVKTSYERIIYKVVEKTKKTYYRVSYIYLDGTKYENIEHLNNLRSVLINEYKNSNAPFDFLAKRYSMDDHANKGGDTGWFIEGDFEPEFENEIINGNHSFNDVFTVDIPEKNNYYIILKTFEPKDITEIKVLKIVDAIN